MQLSKRLSAVAALITPGNKVVDVGTDHAYLPIWLILEKKTPHAMAMDVNQGPLKRAQENILAHRLENYIETRISDGLQELLPADGESLVIAGMGGMLVKKILLEGRDKLASLKELILQPQSDIDQVRRFLAEEGFVISEEDMIEEDGKFYPMMKAVPGWTEEKDRRETFYLYGKCLLEKKNEVLRQYLQKQKLACQEVLESLAGKDSEGIRKRKEEVKKKLEFIQFSIDTYYA